MYGTIATGLIIISFLIMFSFLSIGLFICQALALPYKSEYEHNGIALLDSTTFPVIVNEHSEFSTVILICNKTELETESIKYLRTDFFKFANDFDRKASNSKVLFSQIIVDGYVNLELANKFEMTEESGPKLVIVKAQTSKFVIFNGGYFRDDIHRFITKHTDVIFQAAGTLPTFDVFAKHFMKEHMTTVNDVNEGLTGDEAEEAAAYAGSLEDAAQAFELEHEKESALYYLEVRYQSMVVLFFACYIVVCMSFCVQFVFLERRNWVILCVCVLWCLLLVVGFVVGTVGVATIPPPTCAHVTMNVVCLLLHNLILLCRRCT